MYKYKEAAYVHTVLSAQKRENYRYLHLAFSD